MTDRPVDIYINHARPYRTINFVYNVIFYYSLKDNSFFILKLENVIKYKHNIAMFRRHVFRVLCVFT